MKKSSIIAICISAILMFSPILKAQDEESAEKKSPEITFLFTKKSDGGYELKSRLSLFENRIDFPVANAKIDFIIGVDSIIKIEGNTTDKNGVAIAFIKSGFKIPKNEEGLITAKAEFTGNDLYEAATSEVAFKETRIDISFDLVDSIKTVKVEAFSVNSDGTESPLSEEAVTVSVQRMLSRLPIGDVSLDETGKGSIEFPGDLPGDSLGNLLVVAYISDHELYGNVENSKIVKWGIPKQRLMVTHRALWTQIAPLWMIVSLTFLLIGVWAHYLYVIIQLIIIKLKGKITILE